MTQLNFCKCGSVLRNNTCTNKRCECSFTFNPNQATYAQLEYIKDLCEQLDVQKDLSNLSLEQAKLLIDELAKLKDMLDPN